MGTENGKNAAGMRRVRGREEMQRRDERTWKPRFRKNGARNGRR